MRTMHFVVFWLWLHGPLALPKVCVRHPALFVLRCYLCEAACLSRLVKKRKVCDSTPMMMISNCSGAVVRPANISMEC